VCVLFTSCGKHVSTTASLGSVATWLLNLHKHNGIFRFFLDKNDISVIEGGPSDCKL